MPKKKVSEFTTIQIAKKDKELLFATGMEIKNIQNDNDVAPPATLLHFAIRSLRDEVDFISKQHQAMLENKQIANETIH